MRFSWYMFYVIIAAPGTSEASAKQLSRPELTEGRNLIHMFADVILHRRVPRQFESFTYEIPTGMELQPGQIVEVPFRKEKLSAIVRRLHTENPSYKTKIIEIARPLILMPWQMELALEMSKEYDCSFSNVIDLFIPEKIWQPSRRSKQNALIKPKTDQKSLPGHTKATTKLPLIKDLLATSEPKILFEKTPLPREQFYAEFQAALPHDKSALFLFPELFALKKYAGNLPQFHGELSEIKKAEMWESVHTDTIKTVAGTRAAIFLPFKKLFAIVVDFEHNENYNEKRRPHYNTVAVAKKIALHFQIPLILISATPRTETWHKAQTGHYKFFTWDAQAKIPTQTNATIIDMNDERRKGVTGIFSTTLLGHMARALSSDKQILLFINRTGEAGALLCRDCGYVFKCEKCRSALAVHKNNELQCHVCKIKKPFPENCATCGNLHFKPLGQGTEYVEKEIRKLFGKARIVRLDSETKKEWTEETLQKADVIIATQIIEKPLTLPRLTVTAALAPDYLLNFPHFRATERVMQLLIHLQHLTAPGGQFVIQTFLPNHSLYNCIAEKDVEKFYDDELLVRKSLSLPPFNH